MAGKPKDLTNQHFGRLRAIRPTEERKNKSVVWECECECGNICKVCAEYLTSLRTQS